MKQEIRQCQNCKAEFTIEPDDFNFYQKIKVPAPTFCPECRMQRRTVFRNERTLYRRKCDLCNNAIIAMYPENTSFPVYCYTCWISDKWDALEYGMDFDFTKPFFEQFRRLFLTVPRIALECYQNENTTYSNYTWICKNTYLSPSTLFSENVAYSRTAYYAKDALDCSNLYNSELCYDAVIADKCSHCGYIVNSSECIDSYFLFDCIDCGNCFMSANIRHKSYVFRNQQLSKEEYKKAINKIDFGSFKIREELRREFEDMKVRALHRFAFTRRVVNSSGNSIRDSKNAFNCFDVEKSENVRYFSQGTGIKDSMDMFGAGPGGELIYEGVNVGYTDSRVFFSSNTYEDMIDVRYCDYCRNSQYLFGCIGVRKKQYCILNKKYSKEEYEKLIIKIIEHMNSMPYVDKNGRVYRYREFFPTELSPFAYNETIAQEYFPLTKEKAVAQGYNWRDLEERHYEITKKPEDLPDHIKDAPDSIINEVISCLHGSKCHEQCTPPFRIIPP